jgi:predicted dehydrogenase
MKNIALIGCGNWGKNILRDLLRCRCNVHVVDIDPAARHEAKNSGANTAHNSIDQLPECDGYVVAVTIPSLAPVTLSLLKFSKPVFVEKTLCLSKNDYLNLKNNSGANQIFVMHKWHYHPGIEMLRQLSKSEKIGEIKEIVTTRHAWVDDFHGGDVFWTQAVHDLTIIKYILGFIPNKIKAIHVIKNDLGLPVSVKALFNSDPIVFLSVSGNHTSKISGVSIHGSKGSVELHDALDDSILLRTTEGVERISISTEYPLYLEVKDFLNYLEGGEKPKCGLEDGWEISRALLNLRQAANLK